MREFISTAFNGHEFAKMVEMGLTPQQSIQAGTVNAADLLGWSDKVGTLEPGKWADIIGADGDPLKDVTTLEHVRFVMKGGEVVKNNIPGERKCYPEPGWPRSSTG